MSRVLGQSAPLGLVVTQYRDPITSEARTVTTCPEHTSRMLRVLHAAGVGCGSTHSPSFDCDPCENEHVGPQERSPEASRACDLLGAAGEAATR